MKIFQVKLSSAGITKRPQETEDGGLLFEFIDTDDIVVKDEYHTMEELYQHRMALNIALFQAWKADWEVVKSKLHNDGTMFEGYFIVMATTPYGQISYHYKLEHWDKFDLWEVERTPKWDGHGSKEVLERLMKFQ